MDKKKRRNPHPRSANYYLFSGDKSKKVGKLATKAYFSVKDFLTKDIDLPSRSDVHDKFHKIIYKESSEDKEIDKNNDKSTTPQDTFAQINAKKDEVSRQGDKGDTDDHENDDNKEPFAQKMEAGTKNPTELKNIVNKSNEMLATATTVFPFTLFPDTITLDRTKITIIKRNFFFSNETLSIRIEDVLNVAARVGPILGSITIASRVLSSEDHFTINQFWRGDATHIKHMIQGYVIALHNKIEVAHLNRDELIETLAELGHDTH